MSDARMPIGRQERAKQDKCERIMGGRARTLRRTRRQRGHNAADRRPRRRRDRHAHLYASTKAELLIMVQNQKFAAVDTGLAAAAVTARRSPLEGVIALIRPVVAYVREQVENGRTYLYELVTGRTVQRTRCGRR